MISMSRNYSMTSKGRVLIGMYVINVVSLIYVCNCHVYTKVKKVNYYIVRSKILRNSYKTIHHLQSLPIVIVIVLGLSLLKILIFYIIVVLSKYNNCASLLAQQCEYIYVFTNNNNNSVITYYSLGGHDARLCRLNLSKLTKYQIFLHIVIFNITIHSQFRKEYYLLFAIVYILILKQV